MNNFPLHYFKSKGLTGLANNSNSCYMNTAIQCLSNTLYLTIHFLDKNFETQLNPSRDETNLIVALRNLLYEMWYENCIIRPNSFTREVHRLSRIQENEFHNFDQQDMPEFMLYLINNLHEGLARHRHSKVNQTTLANKDNLTDSERMMVNSDIEWEKYFKTGFSIFIDLFYGQYISVISTIDNNTMPKEMSFTYEPFCTLDLQVPDTQVSIYECLNMMATDDMLVAENQWHSEKTNCLRDAKKNLLILIPPAILIVCFKRFKANGKKNNVPISFPLDNLDISNYTINKTNESCVYNLYAVANHTGNRNNGHYFCYCKNINGKWYMYNDEDVDEINSDKVVSRGAYCLFYQKQDNKKSRDHAIQNDQPQN